MDCPAKSRKITRFLDYWWFRWCLATEMYMVEKWERVTINILFLIVFSGFWYFNYKVILSIVSMVVQGVVSLVAGQSVEGDSRAPITTGG